MQGSFTKSSFPKNWWWGKTVKSPGTTNLSRTKLSTMSLACTSMMRTVLNFARSFLSRGDLTLTTRSSSCLLSFEAYCFRASLWPFLTFWNTSSTSQVHQIWLAARTTMPWYSNIHSTLEMNHKHWFVTSVHCDVSGLWRQRIVTSQDVT